MLYRFASAVAAVGCGGYRVFLLGMGVGRVALLVAVLLVALAAAGPCVGQYIGARMDYPGGFQPLDNPLLADINADGILDIITANTGSNIISVYLGQGNGTFAARVNYSSAVFPYKVVAADVNRDGLRDLVIANNDRASLSTALSVMLGIGNGRFGTRTDYALPHLANGVAVGDVTGDGQPDLVAVMVSPVGQRAVLAGIGGGNFGAPVLAPDGGTDVRLIDVNADGQLDLITCGGIVGVALGLAGGGFGPRTRYAGGYRVTTGDVNNDGLLDLVSVGVMSGTFTVSLGRIGGTFGTSVNYPAEPGVGPGNSTDGIAVGDVTGDGRLDVITSAAGTDRIAVSPGLSGGGFGMYSLHATPDFPGGVSIADLNGDGRPDVVTGNLLTVSVFLNQTTPTATASPATFSGLSLSPNPAHATCTLTGLPPTAAPATATLHNALGQLVRTVALAPADGQVALSVAGLPAGVYAVRVQAGGVAAVRRLVVE